MSEMRTITVKCMKIIFHNKRRKERSPSLFFWDVTLMSKHDESRVSCLSETVLEAITNYRDHW